MNNLEVKSAQAKTGHGSKSAANDGALGGKSESGSNAPGSGGKIGGGQGGTPVDERLWTGFFVAIVAASFFMFLVGQALNAGTTVYLQNIGQSTTLAGVGAFCFSICGGVARIAFGPLIDARGRQLIILISSAVMLLGTLGPLWVNSGVMFVVWRLVQGLGFSGVTTATATAAADVLPRTRLGEGIGYFGLGQAFAMSVGPALGVFLASSSRPVNLYLGISAFVVACIIVSALIRYERHVERLPKTSEYRVLHTQPADGEDAEGVTGEAEVASDTFDNKKKGLSGLVDGVFEPRALHGAIPIFFISCSFCFSIYYMGVYGTHLGVTQPGLFYTFSAVTMILVRLFSGKVMDRLAPIWLMGVAVVCGLLAFGTVIAIPFLDLGQALDLVFYMAGIPYGLSLGLALPVNQAVAVKASRPERWGAANAMYLLANDIGIGICSLLWGVLIESRGYTVTLMAVLVGITVSLVAAAICYPKQASK
jgi:MFS family permease